MPLVWVKVHASLCCALLCGEDGSARAPPFCDSGAEHGTDSMTAYKLSQETESQLKITTCICIVSYPHAKLLYKEQSHDLRIN